MGGDAGCRQHHGSNFSHTGQRALIPAPPQKTKKKQKQKL